MFEKAMESMEHQLAIFEKTELLRTILKIYWSNGNYNYETYREEVMEYNNKVKEERMSKVFSADTLFTYTPEKPLIDKELFDIIKGFKAPTSIEKDSIVVELVNGEKYTITESISPFWMIKDNYLYYDGQVKGEIKKYIMDFSWWNVTTKKEEHKNE